MLQKHQLNWAAWRPTLVLTQQTNYIIAVHIGNHTPRASSLLLFFFSRERKTSNHGPKPWKLPAGNILYRPQLAPPATSAFMANPWAKNREWVTAGGSSPACCCLHFAAVPQSLPSHLHKPHLHPSHSGNLHWQTCTEGKPHSSQLLLTKTKWPAPAQSLKKTTIFQEVLMNCMLQL